MGSRFLLVPVLLLAACASNRLNEAPVLETGDRIPAADATVERVRAETVLTSRETATQRDAVAAHALTTCEPAICAAISRGEVALGMTEAQVLAATRTTESAWSTRDAGSATVMVPAALSTAPRDQVGELAMVQLRDGHVATYSYNEPQGIRVVAAPEDATTEGRAAALAESLLREADDYMARGDFDRALNRYDRAQALRPGDAVVDYRIATILDRQFRPAEALLRYRLFLHRMEIEKIEARGRAWAGLADAIAHARERIIVLERQGR